MNILLIKGHQPYPTSPGTLNKSLVEQAAAYFRQAGFGLRQSDVTADWDNDTEIDHHLWADAVVFQFPLNSMGLPWRLKKYLDDVYTAGMDGRMARGDGRTRSDPSRQYGSGGALVETRYMLSVTLNAPVSAFGDPDQTFFAGRTLDDLLTPVHLNFKFFGMQALPTFAMHDVKKAPTITEDLARFEAHLKTVFPAG
ncbi:MAG: NAD(P)H-dependent oxidoreductase [Hyphomonadaceae bacterium]|nr:NAD(P)H-dependent oxidoreductase [Hyphomonadaceae bacterium]